MVSHFQNVLMILFYVVRHKSIVLVCTTGRVSCARYADVCQELSVSRYPSFAVFKSGGGHEFHHGVVSALGVAQFARESASATNLRTLSQQLFPQLVTQAAGKLPHRSEVKYKYKFKKLYKTEQVLNLDILLFTNVLYL